MDDPGLGVVGDNRLPRLMRSILHPRFGAYLESFINPLQNALARHLPGARDLAYGLTGMVAPQNLRPRSEHPSSPLWRLSGEFYQSTSERSCASSSGRARSGLRSHRHGSATESAPAGRRGKRRFATGEADRDGFSPRRSEPASGAWMLVPSTQHSRKQNCMDMFY